MLGSYGLVEVMMICWKCTCFHLYEYCGVFAFNVFIVSLFIDVMIHN